MILSLCFAASCCGSAQSDFTHVLQGCCLYHALTLTKEEEKPCFNIKTIFPSMKIPISKVRKPPGGRLNIKMPSYQYRDPHVKDKTVSPTVLSLTWESPYLGKTVFILRRGPDSFIVTMGSLYISNTSSLHWNGPPCFQIFCNALLYVLNYSIHHLCKVTFIY